MESLEEWANTAPVQNSVEQLVQRIQYGQTEALEALYDQYAGRVYAFLLRAVKKEQAEELLQDVFLALWQKAYQFDPTRGSFNAWFFTLVRRRLYDNLRSQRKFQAEQGAEMLEQVQDEQDLEEHALQLFRGQEIRAALQSLPPDQRQAIMLTYFGGLSQRELAEQLDLPISTIKGRSRLGLQRLRLLLAE